MGKVFIYGQIGLEVNARDIIAEIEESKDNLEVHINSPGGNVYEGFAIFNALQRKRDILTTYIDGLAYSAASWIALAALPENRYMSKAAQFGIHKASNFAGGNSDDLKKQVEALNKIDQIQLEIYTMATGLDESYIDNIMKADTPLSLKEASAFGFQEFEAEKIAALFNINDMSKLEDLLNHFKGTDKIPEVEAASKEEVEAKHKEAETPIEALSADFTSHTEFLEFKATTQPFMEAIIDYIEKQPKMEEIEAMIEKSANEKLVALLAQIKTKGSVPAAEETSFVEKEEVSNTFEPLVLNKNIHELIK